MPGYPCNCVLSFFLTLGCCKLLSSENLVDNCSAEIVGIVAKKATFLRLAGEGDWNHQFQDVALLRISPFLYIGFNYSSMAMSVKYCLYNSWFVVIFYFL